MNNDGRLNSILHSGKITCREGLAMTALRRKGVDHRWMELFVRTEVLDDEFPHSTRLANEMGRIWN
jgi:hypothetical protein